MPITDEQCKYTLLTWLVAAGFLAVIFLMHLCTGPKEQEAAAKEATFTKISKVQKNEVMKRQGFILISSGR